MASDHIDDDVCVDLLNGSLSETQRDRVFGHIRSCAACERLLQERVADRERLRALHPVPRDRSTRPAESNGLVRLIQPLLSPLRLLTPRPGLSLAVATVAVLLLVVLVVVPDRSDRSSESGPFWLPMDAAGLQLRDTGAGDDDEALVAGLRAYAERDLPRAIELLSAIELAGPDEMMRKIYLGSAVAHLGEYERAATLLETVDVDLLPNPWGGETRWTLYECWRQLGRDEQAAALLDELGETDGVIGDRARNQRSR